MSEPQSEYLTVSEAAARLGISERAVQKRCAKGTLTAQRIGGQWEILACELVRTGEPQNEPQGANRTKPKRNEPANERTTGREPNHEQTNQNEPAAMELLAHLRTENSFLRGLVEQHQRSEAELRAALRKSLDAMPRALPDSGSTPNGEKLQQVTTEKRARENDRQATQTEPNDQTAAAPKQSAPRGKKPRELTAWQRIGARLLGIRCKL